MNPFSIKPILVKDSITLRPYQSDDITRLTEILANTEVRYLTGSALTSEALHNAVDVEKTTMWYESLNTADDRLDLMIIVDDTLIGEIVLNEIDEEMELGNFRILIDPNYASKGYGSQAIQMFLQYIFSHLPIHRVELSVYEFNPRAKRAYEKVGFVYEGCQRKAFRFDNAWFDIYLYAMLKEDYN